MKALLNWRYWVLLAICGIGTVGLLGEPTGDGAAWMARLVISKAVGIAACAALCKLAGYWHGRGSLPEIDKLLNDNRI